MRYILKPDSRGVELRAIWENMTNKQQKIPDVSLEGQVGVLMKRPGERVADYEWPEEVLMGVDILGRPKNQDRRSDRNNNL